MKPSDYEDIQAIVFNGYKHLYGACYLLLEVTDATSAKKHLHNMAVNGEFLASDPDDFKQTSPRKETAIHIAFTFQGLKAMGLHGDILSTFSREYREGMTDEVRSQLLGDVESNEPDKWKWGKRDTNNIHLLLMLFAEDDQKCTAFTKERKIEFEKNGMRVVETLPCFGDFQQKHNVTKEHFGFNDGISNPNIADSPRLVSGKKHPSPFKNPIKTGEFILGHRNEYGAYSASPLVSPDQDLKDLLPISKLDGKKKDLGMNGSYLVFRQMSQDVFGFWNYVKKNANGLANDEMKSAVLLASKMVGRWPGGAPLTTSPDDDNPNRSKENTFRFREKDKLGQACPFGAHIRRANPRDQIFAGRDADVSLQMVRKHQMLRRGRIFGRPFVESMDPYDILKQETSDGEERGLYFICIVGDIARQFEFVQSVWLLNPAFGDQHGEVDPMVGLNKKDDINFRNSFTYQSSPVNCTCQDLPEFTKVIGGAYFFLPGITALKFICT